jgi:hypothetical protein
VSKALASLSFAGFVVACLAAVVAWLVGSIHGSKASHCIKHPLNSSVRIKGWVPGAVLLCPDILTANGLRYRRKHLLSLLMFAASIGIAVLLAPITGMFQ